MKTINYVVSLILLLACAYVKAEEKVPYPEDYRYWTHVKTLALHEGHPLENPFKGIHHIYANKKGVKGIQSGQYEDGATIVFDLLEYITVDNASAEGKRKLIGVMVRDQHKYRNTGGWGFEAWSGNKRLTQDNGASCFACHTAQMKRQYVFSQWRD